MDNKDVLGEAILKGMVRARKKYVAWTTWDFWDAPEYMMTTYCAEAIKSAFGDWFVWPEAQAAEVKAGVSPHKHRGRRPKLHKSDRGRFDIAAYDADDVPRALIELKTGTGARSDGTLKKDLTGMIRELDKRGSTLHAVYYGYYYMTELTKKPAQSVERTFDSRLKTARSHCGSQFDVDQATKGPYKSTLEDDAVRSACGFGLIRVRRLRDAG